MKIIKPGESGRGILVEYDAGYLSPDLSYEGISNKDLIREFKSGTNIGKDGSLPDVIKMYAVLQKWGVENKNGRIYPKEILERENIKYQEYIKMGTSLGECVPAGTEIFTDNGWRNIEDVKVGETIFTMDVNNNKLVKQQITNTIKKPYNDQMIRIYNNSKLDMLVTKKHQIVLWDRKNNPYTTTAEELYNNILNKDSKTSHSYIKNSAEWVGEYSEYFTLPDTDIKIKSEDWAAFLGIFISEGHTPGSKGGQIKNNVVITQQKESSKELIKNLLDKLPFKYSISNNRQFVIKDKNLYNHLKVLGNSKEKHIPLYAKNWSVDLLNILLDWLLIGDGRNRKDPKGKIYKEYCTISKKLSEDVLEIMLKTGNGANITTRIPKDRFVYDVNYINKEIENNDGTLELVREKIINKRLIKAENSNLLYLITQKRDRGIYLADKFTKTELIDFNDFVYCVTVPNGTWLMRYNGKISWTHNCNHPESSIIDLDRVSHKITKTWWEGRTLMGEMELDTTPGYHKLGIISSVGDKVVNMVRKGWTVGISSRGVGSLKQEDGKNVVQDDFELICWDIVTSPSTPGSWISTDSSDLKQFTESYSLTNNCNGYTCQWNMVEEVQTEKNVSKSDPNEKIIRALNNFLK